MRLSPGLKKVARRLDAELRFFKGWVDKPKLVGTIVATGAVTARRMASVVDVDSGRPVLELGPGTGAITREILKLGVKPENLYSIEYSSEFVRHLVRDYPGVHFIQGDAFDLDACLGDRRRLRFDSVISGIPLLNFPVSKRVRYVEQLLDLLPEGRPIVQVTFGPHSPVPPGGSDYNVTRFDFIIRNLPPTMLWLYHRGPLNIARKPSRAPRRAVGSRGA